MSRTGVSVIVPTWNRRDVLQLVLQGLAEQSCDPGSYEIIVADSESGDGTAELVAAFGRAHPRLPLRHLQTRNVLASKRNIGLRHASGEVVIFLDDDCVPHRDFVATHVAELGARPPRSVVCGEVRYPSRWVAESNYFRFRDSRHFGGGRRADLPGHELDERTIVAMNMSARRSELLQLVGEYDERFVGYGCEDHEYGWRLLKAGFRIHRGTAGITHHETTGSIAGYEIKIFNTARIGMGVVARHFPELVRRIAPAMLDPLLWAEGRGLGLLRAVWPVVFSRSAVRLVRWLAVKTDSEPLFYAPLVYRYLMAAAYWRGVRERPVIHVGRAP